MNEPPPPSDDGLGPVVSDLLVDLARRVWRRGRKEIGRAADTSRAALAQRQREADLARFWQRMGRTAYRLVEAGEIEHPALRKAMERIDELQEAIREGEQGGSEGLPPAEPPVTKPPLQGL